MTFTPQTRPWYLAAIILFMVPMTGAGIDLYVPSLPWIVKDLHTGALLVKLTIPTYLIAYAIAPLFFGVWSDNVGRKMPLYCGLVIYIGACLGCILAKSIWLLLAMRFVQGIGISGVGVTFRAMMGDAFEPGLDRQRMSATVTLAWALGPVIAPFIGGYLQHYFGWQANFLFLLVYAALVLLASLFLPETHHQLHARSVCEACSGYARIFLHPMFLLASVVMGILYGMVIMFNVVGPFLIQTVLHYNAMQFGHIALMLGLALFIDNCAYRFLLKYYAANKLLIASLCISILICVVLLLLGMLFPINLWRLVIPLFFLFLCFFGLFSAAMSLCLTVFPQMAAMSGAMMGCIFIGITTVAGVVASVLQASTQVHLATAYLVLLVFCLLVYVGVLRHHFNATEKER